MRKQYHFRQSSAGLIAWDVHRLIALSKNLSRKSILLSSIAELDEPYWSMEGEKRLTCRDVVDHARLMAECDFSYPIILSSDGRVMDGMHRICKALLMGRRTIEAVRFLYDPTPDYVGVHPNDLLY